MVFTCGNCETRAVKSFAKRSYERGVVLVQCPSCLKRHVIADNLGWFGPHRNVEEILRAKGGAGSVVRRVGDQDLDLDLDLGGLAISDIVGAGSSVSVHDVDTDADGRKTI
jgi:mitochondrial protein import protein ZIM17